MSNRVQSIVSYAVIVAMLAACQGSEERSVAEGAAGGAAIGALAGLALGAIAGDAGKGAAIGAVIGGVKGGAYEYDQGRQDRRMRKHAEAIGGAMKGESNDDAGQRHLQDLVGDWKITIWAYDKNNKRVTGSGRAKGVMAKRGQVRLDWKDIRETGQKGGPALEGRSTVKYDKNNGFVVDSRYNDGNPPDRYVGEYLAEKRAYNFYPTTSEAVPRASSTPTSASRSPATPTC